ncbi:MAG TPA: energy transducer TonB, partial [Candidatus Mcinerneyibacteriales bacterium]|nr:energy transducer TonB [Candidatus Mcinerneyibacteriales bacterium]
VFVKAWIDTNGNVKKVVLMKGVSEALDKAAVEAAYRAKFKPAENNGVPVAVWFGFTYNFTLR